MKCKWMQNECALGLECPGEECRYYREPVKASCDGCMRHTDSGDCLLGLEAKCERTGYARYILSPDVRKDCMRCDAFVNGECKDECEPMTTQWCPSYRQWPLVPNWGVEA